MGERTFDQLASTPKGRNAIREACERLGLSKSDLRRAFDLCDAHGFSLTGHRRPDVSLVVPDWDNSKRAVNGHGRFLGYRKAIPGIGRRGEIDHLESWQFDEIIADMLNTAAWIREQGEYAIWTQAHEAIRQVSGSLPPEPFRRILSAIPSKPGMTLRIALQESDALSTMFESQGFARIVIERALSRMPAEPVTPPPPSREALRKRNARAKGRVKARPRKPPRTLVDEVQSREKAVETRRAKLASIEAALKRANLVDIQSLYAEQARTKSSLIRAEKALATFRRRLAESTQ